MAELQVQGLNVWYGAAQALFDVSLAVGAGEPLVLIHGVGLRLDAWAAQIEGLSATHRVIALDMPGHGGSAPLPMGAQLPDFVAWLDELGFGFWRIEANSSLTPVTAADMVTLPPADVVAMRSPPPA